MAEADGTPTRGYAKLCNNYFHTSLTLLKLNLKLPRRLLQSLHAQHWHFKINYTFRRKRQGSSHVMFVIVQLRHGPGLRAGFARCKLVQQCKASNIIILCYNDYFKTNDALFIVFLWVKHTGKGVMVSNSTHKRCVLGMNPKAGEIKCVNVFLNT